MFKWEAGMLQSCISFEVVTHAALHPLVQSRKSRRVRSPDGVGQGRHRGAATHRCDRARRARRRGATTARSRPGSQFRCGHRDGARGSRVAARDRSHQNDARSRRWQLRHLGRPPPRADPALQSALALSCRVARYGCLLLSNRLERGRARGRPDVSRRCR